VAGSHVLKISVHADLDSFVAAMDLPLTVPERASPNLSKQASPVADVWLTAFRVNVRLD
jgi:hypothetical protein